MSVHERWEQLKRLDRIEAGTVSRDEGQSRGEQIRWIGNGRSEVQFEEGEEERRGCRSGARRPFAMSAGDSR